MPPETSTSSAGGKEGSSGPSSKKNSKKPKYSKFSQQELPAWKPILTPGWVISIFAFTGIIFIPIGLASLSASEKVVELPFQYDQKCIPSEYSNNAEAYIKSTTTNKTCTATFKVEKTMKSPIYVYYQLTNYFQNHRRYVKSKSEDQLRQKSAEEDTDDCKPEARTPDGQPIVPCGLIAWSLFNDTYNIKVKGKHLKISKKNIAWQSDQTKKFGSDVYPKNFQAGGLIGGAKLNESIPLSGQEDLIVWMRTAALSTFRKLYGKIETDLEANEELSLVIENNYNTYSFGGKKILVLSTATWIGGKNDFLGLAYIFIGGLSLFFAVCFLLMYVFKPRPLGDPSYLSWNRNPGMIK
ncbi:hypothetical protein K1719_007983 [Acacia pycnantha]|nr:hypothetical protein K1719_007983 [Acacia pycnantha]